MFGRDFDFGCFNLNILQKKRERKKKSEIALDSLYTYIAAQTHSDRSIHCAAKFRD